MSTIVAIEAGCPYEGASDALPGFESPPPGYNPALRRHRRTLIDCAAAAIVGTLTAICCAAAAPGDGRMDARRVLLERKLAQLSPSLAELSRLERLGEGSRAKAAAAAARARPYVELRSLLETLSRDAHAGVAVDRLRQTVEGFELQIHAADSAAAASWMGRLTRAPGGEGAQIDDLRLAAVQIDGQAGRAVEARVRLPSRAVVSAPAARPTGSGGEARDGRDER
ncbi:hypothetical protein [Trinickia dinghuensis]|uniref:Uncharacterized protein n=1 Tax=Trinickia dinghuensis TaxID=2291023 RepID=A0A3D8JR69_9BURK|nr:hypothetical protein [Trinickia dinghuensis]RDU95547.1 hypothetical protein DWV00_28710 [Trinickia dinghuensis]